MTAKINEEIKVPKHSARSAREKKQTRLITIGFLVTLAIILGLVGYSFLRQNVLIRNIPIAKINEEVVDTRYFQDRTRLERNAYIQQYQILNAQYQLFADDPQAADYYKNQLLQFQQILDSGEMFGELVLDKIISDQIIAFEAEKLGISISEEEISEGIQVLFSFYPSGTPTPQPTPTLFSTPTYSLTQEALLKTKQTVTPEDIQALLESPLEKSGDGLADSGDGEAQPTETAPSPDGTPAPTATAYTKELYQEKYQDYVGDLGEIDILEENMRKYISYFLLDQKVRDEIIKDVPHTEEMVWARHILVKTKSEAIIVLSRLENGEDWAEIAADVSLDTSNKDNAGNLDWFQRGQMVPEFETAAFDLQVGEISDPIETDFGWHLIQVIGHEDRDLGELDYETAQDLYFAEWLENIKSQYEIEINDVWRDLVPFEPSIPLAYRVN